MAGLSTIEWTDATWNPVTGCTRVSSGCDHCYAVRTSHRLGEMGQAEKYGGLTVVNGKGERHFNGVVRCHEDVLSWPLGKKKPLRIFVNSMSDLFHKDVPFEFIVKVFAISALCPQHTFQILTKRPERAAVCCPPAISRLIYQQVSRWLDHLDGDPLGSGSRWDDAHKLTEWRAGGERWIWPLPNVWLGTSIEDQKTADERIPHLLDVPAAVRFLSYEPALGLVDLRSHFAGFCPEHDFPGGWCVQRNHFGVHHLHWVIVGGESGPGARTMHPDWVRSVRDQCGAAGVPFFFKQWGEWAPTYEGVNGMFDRVGKKAAGAELDGREHREFPKATVAA